MTAIYDARNVGLQVAGSVTDVASTTTFVETDEKREKLVRLIERTRNLFTQLSLLSGGGVYNRSLKRSIHAVAIEIAGSLPTHQDGRILPLDENPLAYKSERVVLNALASEIIQQLANIAKKHLLTGFFSTSRAFRILNRVSLELDGYAYSTRMGMLKDSDFT